MHVDAAHRSTTARRGRALAATLALTLASGLVAGPAAADTVTTAARSDRAAIERFAGEDRYATAALLADAYGDASAAIVTTGLAFADGLAGAYLSSVVDGPVLLTRPGDLPAVTRSAIDRLGVDTVYVLGGEAAVQPAVVTALGAIDGVETVTRIAGEDRYATAAAIATFDPGGPPALEPPAALDGTVLLATGASFPDALSASVTARAGGLPLLLTRPDDLPQATVDALASLGASAVVVAGGPAAVSDGVASDLEALGYATSRLAGVDRYDTAARFAAFNSTNALVDDGAAALATGTGFADALALGPVAAGRGASVLLTRPMALPDASELELHVRATDAADDAASERTLLVAGGTAAIGDAVAATAADALEIGTTFVVTTAADGDDGSLRDAVDRANANPGLDLITFDLGENPTVTLDLVGRDEDDNATGDLDVTDDVVVVGAGATLDAAGVDRGVEVLGATLVTRDLTITGGEVDAADDATGFGGGVRVAGGGGLAMFGGGVTDSTASKAGGGVENAGSLVYLVGVTLSGNEVTGAAPATAANGGGLHATGVTRVVDGTVADNTAALEGGGLWIGGGSLLTVTGTTLSGNTASGDDADMGGGAVFGVGSRVEVLGATITGNVADGTAGSGGGILLDGGSAGVAASTIDGNSAVRAGGGVEATAGARAWLRGTGFDGNATGAAPGNGGAMHLTGDAVADVVGGTVANNTAAAEGGGFWNGTATMRVRGTTFTDNTASGDAADQGGGALFNAGGTLVVEDATLSGNVADGAAGSGGGVLVDGGVLAMRRSSVAGGSATRAGGGIEVTDGGGVALDAVDLDGNSTGAAPGNGGALHLTGAADAVVVGGSVTNNTAAAEGGGFWNGTGSMTVTDTTFTGNTASGAEADQGGGAIFNAGGTLLVANATVDNNRADGASGSGGGILNDGGELTVTGGGLQNNTASRAGGGIETVDGTLAVAQTTFQGNRAASSPGNGGGIHQGGGTTTIDGATFQANQAFTEGGGVWNAGTMTITGSTFQLNLAPTGPNSFNSSGTLTIDGEEVAEGEGT